MPKITPIEDNKLVKLFKNFGFKVTRQKGSHLSMTRDGVLRPVIIPMHGEVSVTIIQSNLRTAGITREQYFKALKEL